MKKFQTLTQAAHAALNPYDTSVKNRKDIASRYAIPLRSLHQFPPEQIPMMIRDYASDLELFLKTIEDTFERPDIKVRLLLCPVGMGIENIAESARQQERLREKHHQTHMIRSNYSAAAAPIIRCFNQTISVSALMNRLLLIAENKKEDVFVREQALQALTAAHSHATWVFGQEISFTPYDERITIMALNSPRAESRLRAVALGLIDSVRLSRSPSNP